MTTLEQELEALIQDADYRVTVWSGGNYLKLRILYLPKLVVRGEGALSYIANGQVAEQHFISRSPKRRWRRARKWVHAEIVGHCEFLKVVNQA